MIEAIVTIMVPATYKLEPDTVGHFGLSRDHWVEDVPTHMKVLRLEFENDETLQMWLRNIKNYATGSELVVK